MYLKSIHGLHKLIEETDFYKNKLKITDKKLVIDKTNIIINAIVSGNKHNWNINDYEPVPLNVTLLKKLLGKYYKDFINLLIGIEIIETDNSYVSSGLALQLSGSKGKVSPTSKKYGLTLKAKKLEIVKVGVLTERIEDKIKEIKQKQISKYIEDKEIHYKILNNIKELTFSINSLEEALELVEPLKESEISYYENSFKGLHALNEITTLEDLKSSSIFNYSANNKVGRVYHYYTNIPKTYREYLRHSDGSHLIELDLKNSQPLILMLLFYKAVTYSRMEVPMPQNKIVNKDIILWFEENKENLIKTITKNSTEFLEVIDELKLLFNVMVKGAFYKSIAESTNINTNYKELKISILKSLFSYPNDKLSEIEVIIKNKYPYFFEFIFEIKKQRSNKELAHLSQIYESNIFINKVFEELDENVFAIPIHDSIITKENDLHIVKKIIKEALVETFELDTALAFQLITTTKYK